MENLVAIGRFSKMTRLSVKALRLYDEIGLLEPSHVDPGSGYRYYRLGQANRAEAIRILRQVDMPLEEIAEVLGEDEPELVSKMLTQHRERLAALLAEHERKLRYLETLIERKEGVMPYEVRIKEVSDQPVISVRVHTSLAQISDVIGSGFGTLMGELGRLRVQPVGAPFIVYHDVIDEQTEGDIEICIPTTGPAETSDPVQSIVIAGGTVASTIHHGPYDQIGPAYHTLTGWIQDHGHDMTGPPREIYLNDPQTVSPEGLLTEVVWPIG